MYLGLRMHFLHCNALSENLPCLQQAMYFFLENVTQSDKHMCKWVVATRLLALVIFACIYGIVLSLWCNYICNVIQGLKANVTLKPKLNDMNLWNNSILEQDFILFQSYWSPQTDSRCQFHQHLCAAFTLVDPESLKKYS